MSALRANFSNLKNQARRSRRKGQRRPEMEADAQASKYEYHKAMKKAIKQHWDDFSNGTENIWQAVRYLGEMGSSFAQISKRRDEGVDVSHRRVCNLIKDVHAEVRNKLT